MTGIILAGGKSTRFGSDKSFMKINGQPLLKKQIALFKKKFKKIIIVSDNSGHKYRDTQTVKDIVPGCGPLGGIYSGLVMSSSFYNFVIACDMPNINLRLLKHMIKLKNGFDAVMPCLKNGSEPLFAIYSKKCIPVIEKMINEDNLRIKKFFDKIKLKKIKKEEIVKFGKPEVLFFNINTPDDYEKLLSA